MTQKWWQREIVELPIVGRTVSRCCVDYQFRLHFFWRDARDTEDAYEISIGARFRLRSREQEWELSAEEEPEGIGRAVMVFGKVVAEAHARQDGSLWLTFADETVLSVPPDPNYEGWELHGPEGLLIISTPGGGLAIWDARRS